MRTTMRQKEILALLVAVLVGPSAGSSQDKALSFEDMMRFRAIERPVISRDGRWVAYGLKPDRGTAKPSSGAWIPSGNSGSLGARSLSSPMTAPG